MESKSDSAALESYEMDEEISAKEHLNPQADSLASPSKVKFTSASTDGKYGEAKIDVNSSYPTSVGMSKEELKQYANDPFWVRLRLFLFVLFWVMWFAILIGAIAIIALTPKCHPSDSLAQNATISSNSSEVFATSAGISIADLQTNTLTSLLIAETTPVSSQS